MEFRNSDWGGPITLNGDLSGSGVISGTVMSTGGRISPGNAVGGQLTFSSNLELNEDSYLYFGFEADGDGNYRGDNIIVGNDLIMRSVNIILFHTAKLLLMQQVGHLL